MICGDVIADVGSDHAYLPVWLYQNNRIKKAYALDISENCVNRIKTNLRKYNISQDVIIPVLSDGLECFESKKEKYDFSELTDIIIAGMGGENIAEIIEQSPIGLCRGDPCGRPQGRGQGQGLEKPNREKLAYHEIIISNVLVKFKTFYRYTQKN